MLRYVMQEGAWLPQDRLVACEQINPEYFQQRVTGALQRLGSAVTYAHGDCDQTTAAKAHAVLKENLFRASALNTDRESNIRRDDSGEAAVYRLINETGERSRLLSRGSHTAVALPAFNLDDSNSALVTFMQVLLWAVI